MSQFLGWAEMSKVRSRQFAKYTTFGSRELHGSNQLMETHSLTFAKAVQKAGDNGTITNSMSCNVFPVSPLSTIFCWHDKKCRSRKLLRINNLTGTAQEIRVGDSPIGTANSLFQNILLISPLFGRFCGRKQRSSEGKYFRINILRELRKKNREGVHRTRSSRRHRIQPEVHPGSLITSKIKAKLCCGYPL